MRRLPARDALMTYAAAWALFVVGGAMLPRTSWALAIKQVALLAAPAVAAVALRGLPLREGLGLRVPRASALAGAALIGVSFWYLNLWLVVPVVKAWVATPAELAALERRVVWADAGVSARLLAVALAPAVCEELLLRGVVARSLRPRAGVVVAVAASAVLFAALHLPSVRVLPAASFGAALAYAAVITDSVVPAMLMHLLNNLIAVVVLPASADLVTALEAHPHPAGAVAVALTAAGFGLLWRSRNVSPQ